MVESVAENTVDAVVAPALWGALAGAPGALAHRAVNTLDSMVGHRSARYANFGWASARLDDAMALAPGPHHGGSGRHGAAREGRSGGPAACVSRPPPIRRPTPAWPRRPSPPLWGCGSAGESRYGERVELRPPLGVGRPVAPGRHPPGRAAVPGRRLGSGCRPGGGGDARGARSGAMRSTGPRSGADPAGADPAGRSPRRGRPGHRRRAGVGSRPRCSTSPSRSTRWPPTPYRWWRATSADAELPGRDGGHHGPGRCHGGRSEPAAADQRRLRGHRPGHRRAWADRVDEPEFSLHPRGAGPYVAVQSPQPERTAGRRHRMSPMSGTRRSTRWPPVGGREATRERWWWAR